MFSHIASLYNLYVYFWRWALWKVFEAPNVDAQSNGRPGVVSFISASSYLTGPGFLGMREHLRRLCEELWIIDLGGEGHGARREQNVFAIQTPVAICLAVRTGEQEPDTPALVHYARLRGDRDTKFAALNGITELADLEWRDASTGWHDPFTPRANQRWLDNPALTELFPFQTPGTKVGRTWPIAPTQETALELWRALTAAPATERPKLFVDPRYGRRSTDRLRPGAQPPPASDDSISEIDGDSPVPPVMRYGYRSFDRQWIIADARVINLPRPPLWRAHTERQIYMTSLLTGVIGDGPAATVTPFIPDLHHFRGSFGGKDVIPLYRDATGTPNVAPGALAALGSILGYPVAAEDLFAYTYAILSCRRYTERFWDELETPGSRLPVSRDPGLFRRAVELGRTLINLHTYGQRLPELSRSVSPGRARLSVAIGPTVPDEFSHDAGTQTLQIGPGVVAPVTQEVWAYYVSGLQPLRSWLHYRMREPAGRARSSSSPLDRIRADAWTRQLDDELLELIWVLEETIAIEPEQQELLDGICDGATIDAHELGLG
jgi:Type ISP C-terminal specificity domain